MAKVSHIAEISYWPSYFGNISSLCDLILPTRVLVIVNYSRQHCFVSTTVIIALCRTECQIQWSNNDLHQHLVVKTLTKTWSRMMIIDSNTYFEHACLVAGINWYQEQQYTCMSSCWHQLVAGTTIIWLHYNDNIQLRGECHHREAARKY